MISHHPRLEEPAFTHCRDVVVAVSKAGGFGVLGGVGFTPEQLEIELSWIDEHIGDHPYGVGIVIPNKYEGMDTNMSADELKTMLQSLVPQEHLDFARKILAEHGVPVEHSDDDALQLLDWTDAWENPDNPKPLGMPLQYMVSGMAVAATHKYPNESIDVAFNPVGQVVGQLTKVEKTSAVIERWVREYLEATGRLHELNAAAGV
jgi:NAD(P)H-dependent flavin oxidoreductase YrpB (nitropropane dioxygenase family)